MNCSCGKKKEYYQIVCNDCHAEKIGEAFKDAFNAHNNSPVSQADGVVFDPFERPKASFTKHCKKHDNYYSSDLSCGSCLIESVPFDDGSFFEKLPPTPGGWKNAIDSMTKDDYENTLLEQKSARHNTGKINPVELDPQFIMGMAEVLSKSRVKYPEFNWALPTKLSTPYASLFRHLMAFQSGEDVDPEDGCHHMLKVAVNAMFIHYHNVNNKEESDDRFFKKDKK